MTYAVLADTGPLYAALDPSDRHHDRALEDIDRLNRAKRRVTVAYPTLCEAYSLILYRIGLAGAHRWLREVRSSATLINPTPEDYRHAIDRVSTYPDRKLSMFDAALAVLSERLSLPVWAYDHHFDVMRVEVWRDG